MLAITTDMKAPKDVNAVAVSITTNGLVKASFIGRVTPQGDILLPGTLAIVEPDDKNAVIRIRVMAFQNQKPRVIRDVRTTAPPDGRTALLRIPLNFVNDGKVAGNSLPDGLVPDPVPGTEALSPPASATSSTGSGTAAGDAGMVGTKDLSASGGDFDFMLNFQPKDCLNPQDETIINGECHDSFIDSSTLPDFDTAELGDSTGQTGACFDLAKCFASAVGAGQGNGPTDAGSGGDARTPVPPPDAGQDIPDASPKPFKDFRPAAITFDKNTCTIQLNGADPGRLNIAIVTPDTGECVRAGECYVPIDRGTAGWQDDGAGRVQLPSYLCKFLDSKGLSLATSTDLCAAKLESNPICTPKAGDDAGIFPAAEAGGPDGGPVVPFAIPENFPSALAAFGPSLYFAGSTRVGVQDLTNPLAKATAIGGIPAAASGHIPWRFGLAGGGLVLANNTNAGYVLGGTTSQSVTVPQATLAGVGVGAEFLWASTVATGPALTLSSPGGGGPKAVGGEVFIQTPTALAATGFQDLAMVGDQSGFLSACSILTSKTCGPSATLLGQVDNIVMTGPFSGYALTTKGIYGFTVSTQTMGTTAFSLTADTLNGIDEAGGHFAHSLSGVGKCVVYSSARGLDYVVDTGGKSGGGGPILAAAQGKPILGVVVGPDSAGQPAAYYAVFASLADGGGVYRSALPADCIGGGTATDAGAPKDAGMDGAGGCSPASCPTGCCSAALGCQPGVADNACGPTQGVCQDCTAIGSTCGVAQKMCN